MLATLMNSIEQIALRKGVEDRWVWKDSVCEGYTVRVAYSLIRGIVNVQPIPVFVQMWKAFVPPHSKSSEPRGISLLAKFCLV